MRKLLLATVGLIALIATGVAVAHGIEGARTPSAVSATFSATGSNVTTTTCTTAANKSITITKGTYTGTSTGDTSLTGNVTLRTKSVINTTDNVGVVSGQLKISPSSGNGTNAMFTTVYDNGSIAGVAAGGGHQSQFVGNVSATFAPATGFTNGKIGGGTTGGSAVQFGTDSCSSAQTTSEHSSARGTISALSTTSITVAGLTCAIPSDQSSDINSKYKTGDSVQIQCSYANGQSTLTSINSGKGNRGGSGSGGSGQQQSGKKDAGRSNGGHTKKRHHR